MVSLYLLASDLPSQENVTGPVGSKLEPVFGLVILRQFVLLAPAGGSVAEGGVTDCSVAEDWVEAKAVMLANKPGIC